jgi:hypothetical protein
MCTLSVIPLTENPSRPGIRLVVNRDESRLRPAAIPPTIETFGARQTILPRDPQAGGTWIGVNDAGLAMVLLNATSAPAPARPITRGAIIPSLLDAVGRDEAIARAEQINVGQFAPFRLVIVDRAMLAELAIDEGALRVHERHAIDRPLMLTSSGLGDALVGAPRRELFATMFADHAPWREIQDAFHRHRWPGLEGVSVNMSRPEACTVSQTIVEITNDAVTMTYHGAPPNETVSPVTKSLPLVRL